MATIKLYTDLSQSRKLAEFLPPESADMRIGNYVGESGKVDGTNVHYYPKGESFGAPEIINAWSLASLLELLPKRLEIEDNVYELSVYLYGLYYWNIINGNLCFESKDKDNLVDACYDAIVFLHELKML